MKNHQRLRKAALLGVNVYILLHLTMWYILDWNVWGKTAMSGVLSLAAGRINAGAIMVAIIFLSILLYGRFFCGWFCHLRGFIELSDGVMRRLGLKGYAKLRDRNVLLNTRYRWALRGVALFILLTPVYFFWMAGKFRLDLNPEPLRPMADFPGDAGKLFGAASPINLDVAFTPGGVLIVAGVALVVLFAASFMMNYFYGQGAFCRVLCPYAFLFSGFVNLNPFQKKITRVADCNGCRKCANNCPQGIDVSREIYHHDGKVTNRECIKCFQCVDNCPERVLADSRQPAAPQVSPRREYERVPWLAPGRTLQVIEPLPVWLDMMSIVFAVIAGSVASVLGGFWFYVGTLLGFVVFRRLALYITGAELGKAAEQSS